MASNHEQFWTHQTYAVVGSEAQGGFPKLTYRGLKALGKKVFAVDPDRDQIEGDAAVHDFDALPGSVDAVVLEVPKEQSAAWVEKAAAIGVRDVWIHMGRESPDALRAARTHGINLRTGTCAVMYVTPGLSYHAIHRGLMKLTGRY